ncbi:hypothetical protein BGY98DRAFT_960630, partial [Russula aff. rugulosa BPL654]
MRYSTTTGHRHAKAIMATQKPHHPRTPRHYFSKGKERKKEMARTHTRRRPERTCFYYYFLLLLY